MADTRPWVEFKHPEYIKKMPRYVFTQDHYSGDAREKARGAARNLRTAGGVRVIHNNDGSVSDRVPVESDKGVDPIYLYRRAQGESVDNYTERAMISRFPGHTAAVVNSFVGSLFSVEDKADRTWPAAFGDPEEPGTIAHNLSNDFDGKGTDLSTSIKSAAVQFCLYMRVWYLVEEDFVTWISPLDVCNWRYEDGRLVEVLVKEQKDVRSSIKDEPEYEDRFVLYTLGGYERYKLDDTRKQVEFLAEESGLWKYTHYNDADRTEPILPIGYVDLPVKSDPGYSTAQGDNYLYNLLSDVRNLLRIANHPKLAGDVSDEQFEFTATKLQEGSNMLQGPWQFIGPSPENAATAYLIYKDEVREFYHTSHQRYNDAAREATATEMRQDDQAGRQSFLNLLSGALDELERRCMWLLAQKQFPEQPDVWQEYAVKRSTDFKPVDSSEFADRLMARYFSGPIPIGPTGQANAAKMVAALDGVAVEPDEIDAEAARVVTEGQQAGAAERELRALLNA